MSLVTLEKQGHIGIVTLDRPPANALSQEAYIGIRETFEAVNRDDDVWVAILRSGGTIFCAGQELKSEGLSPVGHDSKSEFVQNVNKAMRAVFNCRVPLIVTVQGAAAGAGFTMVNAADIVIASPEAKFGLTEVRAGLVGGGAGASFSLPQKVVRFMALTGEFVPVEELKGLGFVYKIVPREELLSAALETARLCLGNPPLGLRAAKVSLSTVYNRDDQLAKVPLDRELGDELAGTADALEARYAFAERRAPVFQGK